MVSIVQASDRFTALNTSTGELFQAVCDALGEAFKAEGFCYARSSHRMTKKYSAFDLKINLTSSHSNTAGHYVAIEILPYLQITDKSLELPDCRNRDIISIRFSRPYAEAQKLQCSIHRMIFGREVRWNIAEHPHLKPELVYWNKENLYPMDEIRLELLIAYVQKHILQPSDMLAASGLLQKRAEHYADGERDFLLEDGALHLHTAENAGGFIHTNLFCYE